jgi:hypothetical protein
MHIKPAKTVIAGGWISDNGCMVGDGVLKRIRALTESYLVGIGKDTSGWLVLYRDPFDGRYWELTYPQGEMQGGGPPELRCISAEEARQTFSI